MDQAQAGGAGADIAYRYGELTGTKTTAVGELDCELDALEKAVSDIEAKIAPVLCHFSENATVGGDSLEAGESELRLRARRLRRITRDLASITGRIDL